MLRQRQLLPCPAERKEGTASGAGVPEMLHVEVLREWQLMGICSENSLPFVAQF